ncbi:MAG: hypothetical protein ABIJ09_16155 [Pseudomonadota bacterium]
MRYQDLQPRHDWRPIRGCPGRWSLAPCPLEPSAFVPAGHLVHHLVSAAVRDPVRVILLEDGGLISYARSDGTYLHTLNNASGLSRKLAVLGTSRAALEQGPRDV